MPTDWDSCCVSSFDLLQPLPGERNVSLGRDLGRLLEGVQDVHDAASDQRETTR
jgi:hypothetical protein